MSVDMIMPQMGESIVEGTIVRWLKKAGENVDKDEIILEISTDKVDSEIPAPASGQLTEILVPEGETVDVGTVIARIAAPGGGGDGPEPDRAGEPDRESAPAPAPPSRAQSPAAGGRASGTFLSPLVKKIAREHNLSDQELSSIPGSGAKGRISKKDILSYLERRSAAGPQPGPAALRPAPSERVPVPESAPEHELASEHELVPARGDEDQIIPMDHVRRKIAEHMVHSKRTAAHVTTVAEVDVSRIVDAREKAKADFERREGFKLTYTAFFVEAAARALVEFPLLNSSLKEDGIVVKKAINIGFAVGMDKGLIVPVIRHADRLNLAGIARVLDDLASRARAKQLNPEEVQGGTFSITNIGTYGNLFGTPIINQPQVAILGTGAIKRRPVVIDEAIAIRSMMYLSLTYDHRLIDGLYAGSFLQRMVSILERYELDQRR